MSRIWNSRAIQRREKEMPQDIREYFATLERNRQDSNGREVEGTYSNQGFRMALLHSLWTGFHLCFSRWHCSEVRTCDLCCCSVRRSNSSRSSRSGVFHFCFPVRLYRMEMDRSILVDSVGGNVFVRCAGSENPCFYTRGQSLGSTREVSADGDGNRAWRDSSIQSAHLRIPGVLSRGC